MAYQLPRQPGWELNTSQCKAGKVAAQL